MGLTVCTGLCKRPQGTAALLAGAVRGNLATLRLHAGLVDTLKGWQACWSGQQAVICRMLGVHAGSLGAAVGTGG